MAHATPCKASDSTLYAAPPGHLTLLMAARRTASFHLPQDPRFSFYLYVPRSHPVTRRARGEDVSLDGCCEAGKSNGLGTPLAPTVSPTGGKAPGRGPGPKGFPLLVLIHDSSRDAEKLRDWWADLAEEEGCVVLSPHFPCDLKFPDGPDNYKRLEWVNAAGETLRFDDILLQMIDTVSREWGCVDTTTFAMAGFSGGAQLAHRFFYLHPERLHALSVGAPGRATPLLPLQWPEGIVNAPLTTSGRAIDVTELARQTQSGDLKLQLLIGAEDTWHPVQPDGTRTAHSRFDVTMGLAKSWDEAGIKYDFEIVPDCKHEGEKIRAVAMPWMRKHVR